MRRNALLVLIVLALAAMAPAAWAAKIKAPKKAEAAAAAPAAPAAKEGAIAPGFDAAAFRVNFIAGLAGRPNMPPLTPESVRLEAVEKAADFAGTVLYVVKGELAPDEGHSQPFVLFVSADGRYYISDVVDMREGKSILKDARDNIRARDLKTLGHVILKGTGAKTVTYVSDPFCPYCRNGFAYLMGKGAAISELKLAHYPLSSHPGADIACALMAWAADKAPERLLDFVRFAYTDLALPQVPDRSPENLKKAWLEVAGAFLTTFPELQALGKDAEAVLSALGGSKYASEVAEDMAKASGLDVNGTPIFFIGTERVEGFSKAKLDALLK